MGAMTWNFISETELWCVCQKEAFLNSSSVIVQVKLKI